ncbi:MAG: MBL fold metallo-hydrolase [Pseudobdellovibrionaceae bacterium]
MTSPAIEHPDFLNGNLLDLGDLQVRGLSLAGVRTCFTVPSLHCAFDVAQGFPFLFSMNHFFITHTHMDHAAGIPYLISQKNMYHHKPPVFYMPESMIEGLTSIMNIWQQLEEHKYQYTLAPVRDGFEIVLNMNYLIRAFPTVHRVPSFGYTIFHTSKKLKPQYRGLSQKEIQALRSQGKEIQDYVETPILTFTGDTQIEFLDSKPWIRKSKYLFLEATYLDSDKPIEHARKWGHTHLSEIVPQLCTLACEKVVLIHSSSRYGRHKSVQILDRVIPPQWREKVMIFPGQ